MMVFRDIRPDPIYIFDLSKKLEFSTNHRRLNFEEEEEEEEEEETKLTAGVLKKAENAQKVNENGYLIS